MDDNTPPKPAKSRQQLAREKALFELELDLIDYKIIEAMEDFPGITNEQIGALVSLDRQEVGRRKKAEKFRKFLLEKHLSPRDTLKKALPKLTRDYLKLCEFTAQPGVMERAIRTVLESFGILGANPDALNSLIKSLLVTSPTGESIAIDSETKDEE